MKSLKYNFLEVYFNSMKKIQQLECQYKILQNKLNGKLKDSEIKEALTGGTFLIFF